MIKLNYDIELINNYLLQISNEVHCINDDNLSEKLSIVNGYIKQIEAKKAELKQKSTKNEYTYICDLLHTGVKLVSNKFDSIIEKKKEEQKRISSELSKIVVKKKLINYQR